MTSSNIDNCLKPLETIIFIWNNDLRAMLLETDLSSRFPHQWRLRLSVSPSSLSSSERKFSSHHSPLTPRKLFVKHNLFKKCNFCNLSQFANLASALQLALSDCKDKKFPADVMSWSWEIIHSDLEETWAPRRWSWYRGGDETRAGDTPLRRISRSTLCPSCLQSKIFCKNDFILSASQCKLNCCS